MIVEKPESLEIVVSHANDTAYMFHCLDILEQLGFDRKNIWVDGYGSYCKELEGSVRKLTTHGQYHGERCFDILTESSTEYVVIMDSDFFCCDGNFWNDTFTKLKKFSIVSIESPWFFSVPMLTTPFVGYNRESVLKMVPIKQAWNHFNHVIPGLPDPLFDHLMFVFLIALKHQAATSVDFWNINKRKHKFSHFWDSRHTYEQNFADFENFQIDANIRYKYLATGIAKYVFHYISDKDMAFDEKVWDYVQKVKVFFSQSWPTSRLVDTMINLEYQIAFKQAWADKFAPIREHFIKSFCNE